MKFQMFRVTHNAQVLWSIVSLDSVDMVDYFLRRESSPQLSGSDYTMFKDKTGRSDQLTV